MSQRHAVPPPADPQSGFAAAIRERTKAVHRLAERAGFIADLLHARATTAGYALFLRNLHPVYAALEPALTACADDPLAGAFADERLHRSGALASDLATLAGADWAERLALLPEAVAYARAVTAAAADPARLAAHGYARYLGDLSGGQILQPLLARTLHLGADALSLYDFPAFDDLSVPKAAMRAALDTVPVGGATADIICHEAIAAFGHNIALSEAVQAAARTVRGDEAGGPDVPVDRIG